MRVWSGRYESVPDRHRYETGSYAWRDGKLSGLVPLAPPKARTRKTARISKTPIRAALNPQKIRRAGLSCTENSWYWRGVDSLCLSIQNLPGHP